MIGLRPCRRCGKTFEGVRCGPCTREKNRAYYRSEKGRKWYRHAQRRTRRHGLTVVEAEELFEKQGNRCAICRRPPEEKRQTLFVDHCHRTGKVRGGLCGKCNAGLGMARDSVEILRSMIDYLKAHQ